MSDSRPSSQAEGYSEALRRIFSAARDIDDRTMTLQYLEALKQLGSTAATKYVIPLELTDLARRLGNFLDNGLDTGQAVRLAHEHPEVQGQPVAPSGPSTASQPPKPAADRPEPGRAATGRSRRRTGDIRPRRARPRPGQAPDQAGAKGR